MINRDNEVAAATARDMIMIMIFRDIITEYHDIYHEYHYHYHDILIKLGGRSSSAVGESRWMRWSRRSMTEFLATVVRL